MGTTGYFSHRSCKLHEMGAGHPECPQRLDAIEDRLLLTGVMDALERCDAPEASLSSIELAHDRMHVAALQGLSEQLRQAQNAGGPAYVALDTDTSMNIHSWQAALHAAGAAIAATDAVLQGHMDNAFCAVRPPGHHATRNQSMGFCVFNNVAIAALHALHRHGLSRVAIVDFDVHHGNGTEHILAGDPRALMVGFFQHPFYPFRGDAPPADNMLNVPVAAYTRGPEIRELVSDVWLPKLHAFRPEMIFISAGFDAHRDDDMGQMGLTEQDYVWLTEAIQEVAQRHAKGRIVSCLEGGYSMDALARSVEAHVRVLADV